jgi:hypothetical protein
MKLIGLTGLPTAGKDEFAKHLIRFYGFQKQSFAGPLKEAAAILLNRPVSQMNGEDGFNREAILPEWGFSTRDFLQKLGTECLRNQVLQDFWVKRMQVYLEKQVYLEGGGSIQQKVVITDVRFENEAKMIREHGGMIIEITRPGLVKSDHPSDAGIKLSENDAVVTNSGTLEDLHKVVDALFSPDG